MLVAWIRLITLVVAIAIAPAAQETVPGLGAGRAVAPGVLHFTLTDPALLESRRRRSRCSCSAWT